MAARRRKKRLRIKVTPLGYFVSGALCAIALIALYSMIVSLVTKRSSAVAEGEEQPAVIAAEESAPAAGDAETPLPADTPAPTPPPDTVSMAVLSIDPADGQTPAFTPVPTATPGIHNDVRMPTAEQIAKAVEGEPMNSGVAMRKGPDTGYGIVDKYAKGTKLDIYEVVGEYCFVHTRSDDCYGYIASKFINIDGLPLGMLSDAEITPEPDAANVIDGIVTGNKVALRSVPSSMGNSQIGQCNKDAKVWVFFLTNNFYYIEVVGSGEKGYISADYVSVASAVPAGTPVPN